LFPSNHSCLCSGMKAVVEDDAIALLILDLLNRLKTQ
jgi:hypothetical protein